MPAAPRPAVIRILTLSVLVSMLVLGGALVALAYRASAALPAVCEDPAQVLECVAAREAFRQVMMVRLLIGLGLSVVAVGGYVALRLGDRRSRPAG